MGHPQRLWALRIQASQVRSPADVVRLDAIVDSYQAATALTMLHPNLATKHPIAAAATKSLLGQTPAVTTLRSYIRLWKRPRVKQCGRYHVGLGEIEIDAIELLPFAAITGKDVRRAGGPDRETPRQRAAHAGTIDEDTLVYRIEFHAVRRDPVT